MDSPVSRVPGAGSVPGTGSVPAGSHDAHGAHHPRLQHHFFSMEQQLEASVLGMWVFLVTEVMFFGGLFMAYILYRYWYPDAWQAASNHLNVYMGGLNTAVLICSSLTMVLAVRSAQVGSWIGQIVNLILTIPDRDLLVFVGVYSQQVRATPLTV